MDRDDLMLAGWAVGGAVLGALLGGLGVLLTGLALAAWTWKGRR